MCFSWWWKEKPVRTSEKLETLEREIFETEYRLGHSQERLKTVKMHVCVIGFAVIVSMLLWLVANRRYSFDIIPLIVSIVSFVIDVFTLFVYMYISLS